MKKCPPGIWCISNITFTLGIFFLFFFTYIVWVHASKMNNPSSNDVTQKIYIQEPSRYNNTDRVEIIPNIPYTNLNWTTSVLTNPFVPPLKDDRYFIPINIPTNIGAVDTNYRQLGILTPLNGTKKDEILPLMGRPLFTNRQKFQYYTISNQHNNVKLPISVKGRSGTSEHGVDEIYNGDSVYIEGVGQPYKCTIYENDTIRYLPFY